MIGGRVVLDLADVERGCGGILTNAAVERVRWMVVVAVEHSNLPRSAPIVVRVGSVGCRAIDFDKDGWRELVRNFDDITVEGDGCTTSEWVRALRDLAEVAVA